MLSQRCYEYSYILLFLTLWGSRESATGGRSGLRRSRLVWTDHAQIYLVVYTKGMVQAFSDRIRRGHSMPGDDTLACSMSRG